jgi:hypothetical protein
MADAKNPQQGQQQPQAGSNPPVGHHLYPYPTTLNMQGLTAIAEWARATGTHPTKEAVHAAWDVGGFGLSVALPDNDGMLRPPGAAPARVDRQALAAECDRVIAQMRQHRGGAGDTEDMTGFDWKTVRWDILLPAVLQIIQGLFG